MFALELALRNFRLETLAWELSFVGTFTLERSFRKKRLGTFAWELRLGIFGLGSLPWDLWLGILGLGSWAWGTGILRKGEPLGGGWGNLAGRHATRGL